MLGVEQVLGQISTRVMKKDEQTIKIRGELSSLDLYIASNGLTDVPQVLPLQQSHVQTLIIYKLVFNQNTTRLLQYF